jgi:phosphate transport system substrate-binding protein
MIRRPLARRLAAVLAAVSLAVLLPLGATPAHAASTYYPITGTGSTWSQNALDQWRSNVAKNYAMTVNYTGAGSTSGRRDFIDGTVDFAISEIPFQANPEDGSAPEKPSRGYAYMPIVAGGTSFMYNLKISGKRVTNLRLSGDTITRIFTGAISNWNDAAIQSDNPGLAMPNKKIVPVIRSDGSGTSAQFTLWMSKQYPSLWKKGMTSQFPSFGNSKAQKGSDGVSGYVSQNYGEGAITYVEYSYAKKAGFPVAKVLNKSGYYVEPTAYSVAVAMLSAKINTDTGSSAYLTQILDGVYNSSDKRAYPLSSYSYAIVPTEVGGIFNTNKGNTLGAFMRYVLCEGQQQADTLGYSPLPMNLVLAGSDQIKRIPGAGNKGVDTNSCNNPTFKAGDSPSKNQLASSAPYPADCDKKGTSQCTTGTAGAKEDTAVTGTGTGGSATGTTGTKTTGTTGTTGTSVDQNGNVVPGSGTGSTGGAASSPFTLPDQGMGSSQWLMVAAALLLVAAVVVPPLVSQRLRTGAGDAS